MGIQQNNIFCERELVRIYLDKRNKRHFEKHIWSVT